MARVALVYSLIHPEMLQTDTVDLIAELDSDSTIQAVQDALAAGGHEVVRVEADAEVYAHLRAAGADIVFNIAEGTRGESRESHIPAMCEHLGIPYTGSGVLSTALCLDKVRTKQMWSGRGLPTPAYQVMDRPESAVDKALRFPLIAKLAHEGSSMGLSAESIVDDEPSLRRRVQALIETYRQPVLVEEFVEGREFTVGILGNDPVESLPIVEVTFDHPRGINLFHMDPPVVQMAAANDISLPVPHAGSHSVICPARIDADLAGRISRIAVQAYLTMGCRDWCRVDTRLGNDGQIYLLELNPIAGIDPSYLLPLAARAAGYTYAAFVNRIIDLALARTTCHHRTRNSHRPDSNSARNRETCPPRTSG